MSRYPLGAENDPSAPFNEELVEVEYVATVIYSGKLSVIKNYNNKDVYETIVNKIKQHQLDVHNIDVEDVEFYES
jgi:hypothetical protein